MIQYPEDFVLGAAAMGYLIVGLFFFRFWRQTSDGLFLTFAAAFWVLAASEAAFSFGLGWLGWRYRALAPRPGLWLPAVVLLAVLVMPLAPRPWNGIYDFACVAALFPLLVLIGAHDPQGPAGALCRTTGDLSYPLYATHWATWAVMLRLYPDGWKPLLPVWFGVLAVVIAPAVAWVAFRLYDAPVRRRLRRLTAERGS